MGKKLPCSPEIMMNETPSVIGMMSITLSSGGSFDSAVREIAYNGPKYISSMFRKIVLDADCREISDIKRAVTDLVSTFPKSLSSFKRAMQIAVTAFESGNPNERAAMMKDAESIVLAGLRTMGESYSSSLNSPCMMIFGLGIMMPMILISMLPMLSIGGMFSVSFISSDMVSAIVLVIIPITVGSMILSISWKNPFYKAELSSSDIRYLIPILSVIPVYIICARLGFESVLSIVISFASAGIMTFCTIYHSVLREKERKKTEDALKDALFELGNRLSMGENFEVAIRRTFESKKDCHSLSCRIERELIICRGDIESAIMAVTGNISDMMTGYYCDIFRASLKDVRNAGRLATSIAHQLQDQNGVRKDIENKLKSTTDMMTGTSAVFAPLILGMSIVMLGPISKITGQVFFENIGTTLAIYLVELAALISMMSSNLMCKGRIIDITARFCIIMPISLVIFTVCSSFTL